MSPPRLKDYRLAAPASMKLARKDEAFVGPGPGTEPSFVVTRQRQAG